MVGQAAQLLFGLCVARELPELGPGRTGLIGGGGVEIDPIDPVDPDDPGGGVIVQPVPPVDVDELFA